MSLLYNSYTDWKKELNIAKFKRLGTSEMTTEDELIMRRLIEGSTIRLLNISYWKRFKVLI